MLLPETRSVRQLSFISQDRGWMIADRHDLYGTMDGGKTWRKTDLKLSPDQPYLETLCFTDPEHGWIGGWRGAIYYTNDGGVSWKRQDSSTKLDILRMTFVNHLQGWARAWKYGEGSALLATSDGGETWKTVLPDSELLNFTFVDNFEGWSIDKNLRIVHTVDGGLTWSVQRPADETNLQLIFFLNNQEGWVMGSEALLHTSNGGQTWTRVNGDDLPFNPGAVLFTSSSQGWAAEEFGSNLFRTTDGGTTWKPVAPGWQSKVAADVYEANFSRRESRIR
jgi:photosystem II stability/assembly factor-like uncharacterized protein